jgi:hypothetical protein
MNLYLTFRTVDKKRNQDDTKNTATYKAESI